jgi:hypothetical protein
VQRIPEADQRLTYLNYTRQGFRDKQHQVPDSKHAVTAFKDAEEQLERMNYYHSVREEQLRITAETRQATSPTIMVDAPTAEDGLRRTDDNSQATIIVSQWLLEAIPDLNISDTNRYTQQLIDDGFDSVTLLRNQLQIEDLEFMKKGHKRAVATTHLLIGLNPQS